MQILEAFDLTSSYRDAGELAGCSHHTVAAWVAKRDAGVLPVPGERRSVVPPGDEWIVAKRYMGAETLAGPRTTAPSVADPRPSIELAAG